MHWGNFTDPISEEVADSYVILVGRYQKNGFIIPQAILFCCSGKQLFASIIRSEQLRLLLKQLVATGTNILSELGALFHVIFVVVPDVKQMIKYYLIT